MTLQLKRPNLGWILVAILLMILFILSATSCSKEYYIAKYCPKDSVYVETIVHDTVLLTQDRILTLHDTVPCADFELNKDSNGVKLHIVVKDKIITAKCECEGQLIKFRFLEKNKFERHTITKAVKQKTLWWLWLLIGLVSGIAICNIKRIIRLVQFIKPI